MATPAHAGRPLPGPGVGHRVLVVSGSVGAGHDGAARELADRLRRDGVDVDLRDFLSAVPSWAAWILDEGYVATSRYAPALFQALFSGAERRGAPLGSFRWLAGLGSRTVTRWLTTDRYDAVVSTYPVSSQCLGELRRQGCCPVPVVTYVTDPAVHAAWVHPAVDLHVTVTEVSAEQGRADHGVPMTAGGPLVPARFTGAPSDGEVERTRRELSVPDRRPIALLTAGSLGLGDIRRTALDVAAAGFVAVVLCGRNARLRRRLEGTPGVVPLGWRTDVHVLMRIADVLVHNAGGLSFTEALMSGLPAVTYRPIPGHGRANAAILDSSGLAPWAHDAVQLRDALTKQAGAGRQPAPTGDPAALVRAVLDRARSAAA